MTEKEKKAQDLYRAGNELFVNRRYTEALAKYQAAVELWDHAAIRYNMAECYISLVNPLEAYKELERALAHGERPFAAAPEYYERGRSLKERLHQQLGHLTLVPMQPELEVILDGDTIVLDGGEAHVVVVPGAHRVVASRPGYLTSSQSIVLSSNETKRVELALLPAPVPQVLARRWNKWIPWTTAGAGAALLLVGTPLMALANSNYNAYEADIARMCGPTAACDRSELPEATVGLRNRGDQQKRAAQVLWTTGGAILAAGGILTLLNLPRMVEIETRRIPINAEIGRGQAKVTVQWDF